MKLIERLMALWAALWQDAEVEVECVGHMHKVVFNDGDVIVAMTDARLSCDQMQMLKEHLSRRLRGAEVVVLDSGIKLGVISMPDVMEVSRGTH